jgi:hypothetical protein
VQQVDLPDHSAAVIVPSIPATESQPKILMNTELLYQQRLARYTTAMQGGLPDRVPIRPFVAEFCAKHAGFTCQEVAHDYTKAYESVIRTGAKDFEWDAMVVNMVWVWTGLAQAMGLKYYGIPGIHVPADTGFQYHEPPEEGAYMREDEYDELIDDPTAFLLNTWLPRVSHGDSLSMLKGGMAMMQYFNSIGGQIDRMRTETGTVSAIAGILKAPMDILADKFRGYLGLLSDLETQPEKVLAACEALAPHLYRVALDSSDPTGTVPIGFWMHRSCVPLVSPRHFSEIFWPTLRPIIEELWRQGRQTLFYAEGNWDYHLADFATLPAQSIVYHIDQGDPLKASPCVRWPLLSVRRHPQRPAVLRHAGAGPRQGARRCWRSARATHLYHGRQRHRAERCVMENMRALTEETLDYGTYSRGHAPPPGTQTARPPLGSAAPPAPRPVRWNPGNGFKTAGPPSSAIPRW